MNCAPGKIGTPRFASVGATWAAEADPGAVGAAGAVGAGRGGGCPGRGNGCGVGCCRASRTRSNEQRTQRVISHEAAEGFLCVLCPVLCVLVTIMPTIISL